MDNSKRETILNRIRELDPKSEIAKIDIPNNKIEYSTAINQHRAITNLTGEEIVRAYFLTVLWKEKEYAIDKFELEDEHLIGNKAKKTKVRIDIRVNKNSHPFMIFETKDIDSFERDEVEDIKSQLFNVGGVIDPEAENLKWLIYCSVDVNTSGGIEEFVKVIDYSYFRTFEKWDSKGRISHKVIPKKYGTRVIERFVKGGLEAYERKHKSEPDFEVLALKPLIPKERLEKLRKKLHDTLWSGGKRGDNKIFFNLVKLVLAKVYDEKETQDGEIYKFQIVYISKNGGAEEDLLKTTENVNELYSRAFFDKEYLGIDKEELEALKKREGAIDLIELEDQEIAFILDELQQYEFTNTDFEFLGEFFEAIIREEFKQSVGQYFTHKNIVDFILYGIEFDKLLIKLMKNERRMPYMIDPSCGSGTFLIQAIKLTRNLVNSKRKELEKVSTGLEEFLGSNFPQTKKQVWAQEYLYGIDFSALLGITTKVNMVLHGDGHVHTYAKDALSDLSGFSDKLSHKKSSEVYEKEVNEKFDVVISNPPFATSLDPRTELKLKELYTFGDKEVSENLFIERYYQLLKENGRLGVVLPESVFDTTKNTYIRLFLFKYFWIKAIVSLPGGQKRGAFAPYTSTKTCLFFGQKKTVDEVKEWDDVWDKNEKEYYKIVSELRTKIDKKITFSIEEQKKIVEGFKSLFKVHFEEEDEAKDFSYILDKYSGLMKDKRLSTQLKDWWIFYEVSKYFDKNHPIKSTYPVFHVEEIGYKRTKRGERKRPNYLYNSSSEGIEINTEKPTTVLDAIRGEVKWD